MPSVCTAHQAEPEEAEAEVPQVSPQPPSHSPLAFSSVPATLAVLRGPRVTRKWEEHSDRSEVIRKLSPFHLPTIQNTLEDPWNLSQCCN